MALARCATVILRNMHMDHVALDGFDRGYRILFFNVGMEGVVHGLHMRVVNVVQIIRQLCHGVQEVAFEAVERLNGKTHILLCCMVPRCPVEGQSIFPLLRGGTVTRKIPDFGMHRPRQNGRTQSRRTIQCPFGSLQCSFAFSLVLRQRVMPRTQHTYSRHAKAELGQMVCQSGIMVRRAFKQWQLNAIITCFFQCFENRHVFVRHMPRPQQQVKSILHLTSSNCYNSLANSN